MSRATVHEAPSRKSGRPSTRFAPPIYQCATQQRPRLEDRLREAVTNRTATVVSAPAGYGKSLLTSTVCRTLEEAGARTVWIHMDARDNSYDRMIQTLDLAFRPLAGDDHVGTELSKSRKAPGGAYLYLLEWLEDLANDDNPLVLVLDDYEVVNDPQIHALFDSLITRFIPNVHTIVLSRTQPALSLSMLRHRRQLCEIGRADLSFTGGEIASLLHGQFKLELTDRNLRIIEDRTEGWPVAVQLVGTALSQRSDTNAFIADLSGSDVDVADFLSAEVLSRQPPELIDFLVRISPLTRVSLELCAAVTGSPKATQLLDRVVKSNLLLFPVDRNNAWFRFHPLFREFLVGQIACHPEISREAILRPAIHWCEGNGLPADAINYALELDDHGIAARLIMQHAERFVYTTGDHSLFLAWMARLRNYPQEHGFELRYWQAWALIISHRVHDAASVLADLEAFIKEQPPNEITKTRKTRVEIIRILLALFRDQLSECVNAATEWLNTYPGADPFDTCSMATALAEACCATGEFATARTALQTARFAAEAAGSPYAANWVGVVEGHIAMSVGDYPLARTALTHRFEESSRTLGYASSALSTASLLLSETCYLLGDLEGAEKYLKFGLPHIGDHGLIESAAAGFRVMIRSKDRHDGFEAALAACYDCERLAPGYGPRLTLFLLNEYVCLALRHGKLEKAAEATGFTGEHFINASINVHENAEDLFGLVAALIKIRVLIAAGRPDSALRVLSPVLAAAARANRRAYKVELLILRSRAEDALGKQQRAHRTLLEALSEAMPLGMVQIFADEGVALRPLLDAVIPMLVQGPDANAAFVEALSPIAVGGPKPLPGSADEAPSSEALSSREIQILRLLDSGLTNEAVASRLFLSLRTVKWYLYNVYPKLGVKNRTGALARARKLGLI